MHLRMLWVKLSNRSAARRRPRQSGCVSYLVCRDPWGWGRRDPSKTRLAHGAVGTLPFPVQASQFLAVLHQHRPDALQDTPANPPLHSAVNAAVVAKLHRQLVPLAAAAHLIDDTVERVALPGSRPARLCWWVQFLKDGLNYVPQFVVDFLNRRKRYYVPFPSGHPWLLCWCYIWLSARQGVLRWFLITTDVEKSKNCWYYFLF